MGSEREMKLQLALSFLMLGVLAVTGQMNLDPCTHGYTVLSVFGEERSCEPIANDLVESRSSIWRGMLTVEGLRNMLTEYCSTGFPAMRECFMTNIEQCSEDQRVYLSGLANETGFVCQPNSSHLHPNVVYLLSHMTDATQLLSECPPLNESSVFEKCVVESSLAAGYSMDELPIVYQYDIQHLVPLVSMALNAMFECVARTIRESEPRCADWRWQVLEVASNTLMPTILTRTNTFTQQQLATMFEF